MSTSAQTPIPTRCPIPAQRAPTCAEPSRPSRWQYHRCPAEWYRRHAGQLRPGCARGDQQRSGCDVHGAKRGPACAAVGPDGSHCQQLRQPHRSESQHRPRRGRDGVQPGQRVHRPEPASLPNQRVGAVADPGLEVSNRALPGIYTEGLNASFGASTADARNNGGTITRLAGGTSNSSA